MSTLASFPPTQALPTPHVAARHIATEASTLLTSLRGGPPHVAHGELAAGLHALRGMVQGMAIEGFQAGGVPVKVVQTSAQSTFLPEGDDRAQPMSSPRRDNYHTATDLKIAPLPSPPLFNVETDNQEDHHDENHSDANLPECPTTPTQSRQSLPLYPNTLTPHAVPSPNSPRDDPTLFEDWQRSNSYMDKTTPESNSQDNNNESKTELKPTNDPGPYVAPFLSVIIDPRFSGPHTLVALRSLYCLLSRGSIVQLCSESTNYPFYTHLQPIALGILACRFEQTDAGADEAVEMAIADLLGLIIQFDGEGVRSVEKSLLERVKERKRSIKKMPSQQQPLMQSGNKKLRISRLPAAVIMEAFHAVFVTRQTFVKGGIHMGHFSPALSNHFEQVLMKMIHCVFGGDDSSNARQIRELSSRHGAAAKAILEFLVDQVLSATMGSEGAREHQDGKAMCLRLIQCCIRTSWGMRESKLEEEQAILRIVQDDLCLALLTTGQAIWADDGPLQDGFTTSPEILSEVCSTLSLLWSLDYLRKRLHSQFVAIFSGFYQRALSLLRKRPLPEDGAAFQSNMVFDSEAEIILENLVDILCIQGGSSLSTLEELFGTYDCSMIELDVASGLLVELSLCCGGIVDEEDNTMPYSKPSSTIDTPGTQTPNSQKNDSKTRQILTGYRPVPDHLKELCSQALLGCIKQLYRTPEEILLPVCDENKNSLVPTGSLRRRKEKKQVLHTAAKLFNDKPSKGIQHLLDNGILPDPVTPESVSSFLRNGLVVGLDKAAVGQYLGEKGKVPSSDKNPAVWDCEWFHKDVLAAFCSSFAFKNQSLLDGLRMFLATFRLPGEAQMIDRILQGFSESCGCSCEESMNGSLKLFSKDEKRASDAAYLLSFSIIMLNTDLVREYITIDNLFSFDVLLFSTYRRYAFNSAQ